MSVFETKDSRSPGSSSQDNSHRIELLWESREENVIKKWVLNSTDKSKYHHTRGLTNKYRYALFTIPTVLIPIIISGIGTSLDGFPLIRSLLLILSGSVAGVAAFFNFGSKMAKHFEYEALYDNFRTELDVELSKPKANRIQCDVFLQKYLDKYNQLNSAAPV